MAAALYNRYRPRTFAEVVGQEHVTSALISALEQGRTHHAYLFSGPRGCGKTSSARILAASLNCVHGPTPTPCGECEQCVAIRTGSSIDVVEIDAASHGGVDDARDLRERALYVPASGRYRIFVVDEAHQVSRDGFNALLKIVEEPPDYLVFVFATTEPDKVLPTIRSRTFSYQFRLVPPGALRDHLAHVVEAEGATLAPEVLPLVVRAGQGSVRDSLSVLDQLISGGVTTYEQAAALLGVTDVVLLDDATTAIGNRDGAALFGVVERVLGAGHDPRAFARDLLERLRDLLLIQAVPDASERGLVDHLPPDQLERMRQQAANLGAADLSRSADVVANGLVEMRGTTSPRLVLELVCARLLLPSASGEAGSLAARLDALERRLAVGGTPAAAGVPAAAAAPAAPPPARHERPAAAPASPERPAAATPARPETPPPPPTVRPSDDAPRQPDARPVAAPADPPQAPTPAAANPERPAAPSAPAAAAVPGEVDLARLQTSWPLVLDATKKRSRVAYALVSQDAQVGAVDGSVVTLAFTLPTIARNFEGGPHPGVLAEALAEVVGGSWTVRVSIGAPPAPAAATPPVEVDLAGDADPETDEPVESPAGSAVEDPVTLAQRAFGATVVGDSGS